MRDRSHPQGRRGRAVVVALFAILALAATVAAGLEIAGILFANIVPGAGSPEVTPLSILHFWTRFHDDPRQRVVLFIVCAVALVVLTIPGLLVLFGPNLGAGRRARAIHGEARWARTAEIRRAGLLGQRGIVVGRWGRGTLLFDGAEQGKNVLVAAPPGSGKTTGIMIPNCLYWPGSLVALDLKGDCYARSAGFRQACGQKVYRLEFLSRGYRTHQYNPFAYVSSDPNFRVGDVERIARYLCPEGNHAETFWILSAREMFRALVLYLYAKGAEVTLGAVRDMAEIPEGLQTYAKRLVKEARLGAHPNLSDDIIRDFATIAHRSENTHSGIKDQLMTALAPFANPLVRMATSANSFDIRRIRHEPMSIYLVVARPDVTAIRPLLNLFVQQLVDLNTTEEFGSDPGHRHEVLLAMDEFAQVGRLDAIFHGITFFRSFGIRLLAILQSPSQLREIYSADGAQTFERCFDCSVYFTPAARDLETAEDLSRLLGYDTVKGRSRSERVGILGNPISETESDQRRALLLPQEVLRMPMDRQVLLVSGMRPILAQKIRSWMDEVFTARTGPVPEAPLISTANPDRSENALSGKREKTRTADAAIKPSERRVDAIDRADPETVLWPQPGVLTPEQAAEIFEQMRTAPRYVPKKDPPRKRS